MEMKNVTKTWWCSELEIISKNIWMSEGTSMVVHLEGLGLLFELNC